jgi:hypothetical protein
VVSTYWLFTCAGSAPTLKAYVLDREADPHSAYALLKRLHTALLTEDERAPGLLNTLDVLEREMAARQAALNQFAAKPQATAATIVNDLIAELASVRNAPALPAAASGPQGFPQQSHSALSDTAFEEATTKSQIFVDITSSLSACDQATKQGRIDAIAIGFEGSCVVACRTLLSTTAAGDPDHRKHPTLRALNGLRQVRMDYFNYILTVDFDTKVVPHRLRDYTLATLKDTELMTQFLNRQFRSMNWIDAPHGLNGFLRYDDNKSRSDFCNPADHFCQPMLIRKLASYGQRLFSAIGTSPTADPAVGFTFATMCDRYAQHLEVATKMNSLETQVKWMKEAVELFGEILDDISMWINLMLAAPNVAAQNLAGRPLVYRTDTAMAKLLEKERVRTTVQDLGAEFGFAASSSSNPHFNPNILPLLSSHAGPANSQRPPKTKRKMADTTGLPPGSNFGQSSWSADGKYLAVSGVVWNVPSLAAFLSVSADSLCWEVILARVRDENKMSRCPKFGTHRHKSATDSAHVIPSHPNGLDLDALAPRFARPLSDKERSSLKSAKTAKEASERGRRYVDTEVPRRHILQRPE